MLFEVVVCVRSDTLFRLFPFKDAEYRINLPGFIRLPLVQL